MAGFKSSDEIIQQAFTLAYFIHGDEAAALAVVREALSKLEVAAAAQIKRLYYAPTRRSLWSRRRPANSRTKISLSDQHLLQRLIYVESEPYERARERQPQALHAADLLIHFIKHLIRISIKRNSFYVALGISRLLHNYSTNETMEIYNVVVQDPERVKDDYYYRSRKGRLLQEIKERFDEFVNVQRGARGEERFQTLDAPAEFSELVAECLTQFSPWQTPCSIPARYDPTMDEIPTLSSAHESEEDKVEINRIHAVVHPDCYELLINSLKLEPPALRLSVPRFNLPNGKNNMSRPTDKPRRPAPPLAGQEVAALKQMLSEQSARRKATQAGLLSVVVDKVERARLDLKASGSISFAIDERAELIEVRALDGDSWTLLATHLLGGEPPDNAPPTKSEIMLEGGQRLTFQLSSARGAADEAARMVMSISYQETEWLRAGALHWRRLLRRITAPGNAAARSSRPLIRPAFAALLLILCMGALLLYVLTNRHEPETKQLAAHRQQPIVAQSTSGVVVRNTNDTPASNSNSAAALTKAPTPQPAPPQTAINVQRVKPPARNVPQPPMLPARPPTTQTAQANTSTRPSARPSQPDESASSRLSSATQENRERALTARDVETTRSVAASAGATALTKVRKVFIEVRGDGDLSAQTANLLADSLRAGQRLTPTAVKDDADAAFKINVSAIGPAGAVQADGALPAAAATKRRVTVSVRLVNEAGEVIWPAKGKSRVSVYTGTVKNVADRIARDVLKDVRKSDAQK